jgi:hypothetical protein
MENLIAVITAAPLILFVIFILAKDILRTCSAIRGIVTFALQMTIIRALPRGFLVTAAGNIFKLIIRNLAVVWMELRKQGFSFFLCQSMPRFFCIGEQFLCALEFLFLCDLFFG